MNDEVPTFEENFETLPEAAREFFYRPAYKQAIENLAKEFNLEGGKAAALSVTISAYLAQEIEEDELIEKIKQLSPEKSSLLLQEVNKQFVIPILEMVTASHENDEEVEEENPDLSEETISAPSPAEALKSIQEQLTTPTPIAPTQREQSISKQSSIPERKIDPYHEPIE